MVNNDVSFVETRFIASWILLVRSIFLILDFIETITIGFQICSKKSKFYTSCFQKSQKVPFAIET